jgi:ubiquinone/menaquinone biosynthesis C-methylase UbiE
MHRQQQGAVYLAPNSLIMDTQKAYNHWAGSYDTDENKTRDLEMVAGRQLLEGADFTHVLEIGCGTGKNTSWLAGKAKTLTAADFSEEMMKLARQKVTAPHVQFHQADITQPWNFSTATLITFSLVLEHIQDLDFIFEQAACTLPPGGLLYICELHPYKQLQGSRARFEQGGQLVQLEYFVHHISEFFNAARRTGLQCERLDEWFDSDDRNTVPRLVSFLFRK